MGASIVAQHIAQTMSVALIIVIPLVGVGFANVARAVAEANREADRQLEQLKTKLDKETEHQKSIKREIEKSRAELERLVARLPPN